MIAAAITISKVTNFAGNKTVHMISTPPHRTHRLHFRSLTKLTCKEACLRWIRQYPGLRMCEYDITGTGTNESLI
jgi:hypothetical protein